MVGAAPPEERIASLTDRLNVAHGSAAHWRSEAEFWFDRTAEAHLVVRRGLGRALREMRRIPDGREHVRVVLDHIQEARRMYRAGLAEAAE